MVDGLLAIGHFVPPPHPLGLISNYSLRIGTCVKSWSINCPIAMSIAVLTLDGTSVLLKTVVDTSLAEGKGALFLALLGVII